LPAIGRSATGSIKRADFGMGAYDDRRQRRDGLAERVRRDDHALPDLGQQGIHADDFARLVGQAQQQAQRVLVQPDRVGAARHLAAGGADGPVADTKLEWERVGQWHGGSAWWRGKGL
jgi:hypothetical protein